MYLAQILGEVSEINSKNESSLILGKFNRDKIVRPNKRVKKKQNYKILLLFDCS